METTIKSRKRKKILALSNDKYFEAFSHNLGKYFSDEYAVIITESVSRRIFLRELEELSVDCILLDSNLSGAEIIGAMNFIRNIGTEKKKLFSGVPMLVFENRPHARQDSLFDTSGRNNFLSPFYDEKTSQEIIDNAINKSRSSVRTKQEMKIQLNAIKHLANARFFFKDLAAAQELSLLLSNMFRDKKRAYFGLNELTLNAIEHGILGIGEKKKTELYSSLNYYDFIESELKKEQYASRQAHIDINKGKEMLQITITDNGKGFASDKYLHGNFKGNSQICGKGIMMTKEYAFPSIKYNEKGNQVIITEKL